jgi:hypothetical protein
MSSVCSFMSGLFHSACFQCCSMHQYFIFFFLRQVLSLYLRLTSNLLCSPDWSGTHSPSVSATQMQGLQSCTMVPSYLIPFFMMLLIYQVVWLLWLTLPWGIALYKYLFAVLIFQYFWENTFLMLLPQNHDNPATNIFLGESQDGLWFPAYHL